MPFFPPIERHNLTRGVLPHYRRVPRSMRIAIRSYRTDLWVRFCMACKQPAECLRIGSNCIERTHSVKYVQVHKSFERWVRIEWHPELFVLRIIYWSAGSCRTVALANEQSWEAILSWGNEIGYFYDSLNNDKWFLLICNVRKPIPANSCRPDSIIENKSRLIERANALSSPFSRQAPIYRIDFFPSQTRSNAFKRNTMATVAKP